MIKYFKMANWYKTSWNHGIALMDEYSDGWRPPAAEHKYDPRGLVNAKPEFGGKKRPGYPKNYSANPDEEETPFEKIHGRIPGEEVLMDDGGDSHTGLGDRFVAQDEFNTDDDKDPIGSQNDSVRLDKGPPGIHDMPHGEPIKGRPAGDVFKRIKQKMSVMPFGL
jgi:hypothetical protein